MNALILLIGSNPLPNYIVAKYLTGIEEDIEAKLIKPDLIILVHTTETERFARQIQSVLNLLADIKIEEIKLEENGRKPKIIRKKIIEKLDEIKSKNKINSIHLNYIGGTKTMAVQTVKAVEEWLKDKMDTDFVLSDVDPRIHKIIISENGIGFPKTRCLLDIVKLTTAELLKLHGMKIRDHGKSELEIDESDLIEFCRQLLEKYKSDEARNFNKKLRSISGEFDRVKIKDEDDKETEQIINNSEKILNIKKEIMDQLPILKKIVFTASNPNIFFIKFVTGGWLEQLVQRSLIHLKPTIYPAVNEVRCGVKAEYEKRSTEIDVIAIQGYQLYLFSCTTSNKISDVKHKAFEAIYRAEQLGGEHAKVIIVCTLFNDYNNDEPKNSDNNVHNLKELEKDLSQFDAARNCSLIGIDELTGEIKGKNTLTNRIKYILEGGK